jgi:molybdenum cofactor guanylyltransferase
VIVAVLAGGRGSRMGGSKATIELAGAPLIERPLAAARAAGLEAVVVAKRATVLPPGLGVPVWLEPDTPFHPLCGLVAALERGPVVAVACDQPWVTGELLGALAAAGPAVPWLDGRFEPFPGHYDTSQLPVLRDALAEEASLHATLARLAPMKLDLAPFGDPAQLVGSVNTREELAAAERELAAPAASGPPAIPAAPDPPAAPAAPAAPDPPAAPAAPAGSAPPPHAARRSA